VEEFVVALEGRVIVPAGSLILKLQKVVDPLPALRVERRAGPAHDGGLDRLSDEARFHHLPHRDLHDRRSALGLDLHQPGPGQTDQGLADRLAGNAVALGDVLLGEPAARRELQSDDEPAQLAFDALGRRAVTGRKGAVHNESHPFGGLRRI
jgi:hypothetical protein